MALTELLTLVHPRRCKRCWPRRARFVAYLAAAWRRPWSSVGLRAHDDPAALAGSGQQPRLLVFGLLHPSPAHAAVVGRAAADQRAPRRRDDAAGAASRRPRRASDLSGLWLRPYMKPRRLKAGTVLFRKGDLGDHLYCVVDGQIGIGRDRRGAASAGQDLRRDRLFRPQTGGARFTARCVEAAPRCWAIDEGTVKQLVLPEPGAGLPPDRAWLPGGCRRTSAASSSAWPGRRPRRLIHLVRSAHELGFAALPCRE